MSPRGAESARDTGDLHLNKSDGPGESRRSESGCHSPEPRAVSANRSVANRCTSIAPNPQSRKHYYPAVEAMLPESVMHHQHICPLILRSQ